VFPFLILVLCKVDQLAFDQPDKFDFKLAKNDLQIINFLDQKDEKLNSKIIKTEENLLKLDNQVDTLRKYFESKNIHSLLSSNLWEKIYKFILENLDKYLKDSNLFFSISMRYSLCTYIIPLLPTEYFLIFPSFYKILIPKKVKKNEIVKKFIKSLDKFLLRVKYRSKRELLPNFRFIKKTSLKEDLEMIREIPKIINSEPLRLIKWVVEFEIEESSIDKENLQKLIN
jgi:hypothetical protein